ncbi:hypothetical protein GMOD_00003354 [Pyrenophora seminiperda CCB06]|uniref:Secreted protein n=1 Tax=Pyrenophora seminiperda CCB06 TaxID=1302712 RepID=A0A3M7MIS7_9PLEO|nr:hypothetical protein GMOD_00003354 [Pyrenophora seminiperda CCB06]
MRTKPWFLILTSVRLVAPRDVPDVALRATGAQAATSVGQTTLSPASVITPAPVVREDIFKRAIATCGFVRGNSGKTSLTITASLQQGPCHCSHAVTILSARITGEYAGHTDRLIAWASTSRMAVARPSTAQFFNGTFTKNPSRSPHTYCKLQLIRCASVFSLCAQRGTRIHGYVLLPPQLKHEGTVTTGPGPGSIASWNLLTPTGANPHVPPSYASVSEYGDYGPSVHQPLRPMDTLHERHSQRSFGYGSR